MSDTVSIFIWWGTLFLLGICFYPITSRLFGRFVDKGYAFSKILGIFILSYTVWLLGSLHIAPFTPLTILIVLLVFFLLQLIHDKKSRKTRVIPWRWIVLEEILFLLALAGWSYVRASEPSIRGLEKFMDFGFVNSILRTTYFPPLDMWLAKSPTYTGGHFINYYYFGHYYTALLTKLSSLDSSVTYNLMIATLFAFTFTLSFSLSANLFFLFLTYSRVSQKYLQAPSFLHLAIVGLLAAFLVSLAGNLHTMYILTEGYPNEQPRPPWTIPFGFHPDRYWYPNATRFIYNTIHEFPIYSFVVADLHGHVADIPFVLLLFALLLSLLHQEFSLSYLGNLSHVRYLKKFLHSLNQYTDIPILYTFLLGTLLAVMYMTNAWDGLIYMPLTAILFLFIHWRKKGQTFATTIRKTTFSVLLLFLVFLLTSMPFTRNFKPFVSGVGVLCAPEFLLNKQSADSRIIGPLLFEKDHCQKSPLYQLAILWGFFYYNVGGFLWFVVLPSGTFVSHVKHTSSRVRDRLVSYFQGFRHNLALSTVDMFVLALIGISTLLLIFPEFFYLKDIYPAHYRANTMFKLGYQAFMMLGLVSTFAIVRIKYTTKYQKSRIIPLLYNCLFVVLFALVGIYPYFAISSYYGKLQRYAGLDGLSWMNTQYPDDYQAILWLRRNVTGQPVIVEANGDSYTDYDRVSSYTGLPTIVGWPVHEWLWRGSYDEPGGRIPQVASIYEAKNPEEAKDLLKKYNAEYMFLGKLEREKYPTLNIEFIESLGPVVFQSGETKVYRVNR